MAGLGGYRYHRAFPGWGSYRHNDQGRASFRAEVDFFHEAGITPPTAPGSRGAGCRTDFVTRAHGGSKVPKERTPGGGDPWGKARRRRSKPRRLTCRSARSAPRRAGCRRSERFSARSRTISGSPTSSSCILSPEHPSMMSEILATCTKMPVRQVNDAPQLQPNCVYVIPPDRELVIDGDNVTAREFTEPRGRPGADRHVLPLDRGGPRRRDGGDPERARARMARSGFAPPRRPAASSSRRTRRRPSSR